MTCNAAEKTILELWDTLKTDVPVEDAMEANRLYPLFSIMIQDLEKKREAARLQ